LAVLPLFAWDFNTKDTKDGKDGKKGEDCYFQLVCRSAALEFFVSFVSFVALVLKSKRRARQVVGTGVSRIKRCCV